MLMVERININVGGGGVLQDDKQAHGTPNHAYHESHNHELLIYADR